MLSRLTVLLLCCMSAVGQEAPKSCVIVARHVPKFGENVTRWTPHKIFDYVEGPYPAGFKWHSDLNDGDIQKLQRLGAKVVILRATYETADLADARKQCQSEMGK